jgi:hypothetical protein
VGSRSRTTLHSCFPEEKNNLQVKVSYHQPKLHPLPCSRWRVERSNQTWNIRNILSKWRYLGQISLYKKFRKEDANFSDTREGFCIST